MNMPALQALSTRVNTAEDIDQALLREAAEELRAVFPHAPEHPELLSEPTEAVLWLVDRCLPGWTITLRGTATEPDGHWHCSLRQSGDRDDDAVIGNATAPTVSLALLRALVAVARLEA
jgi:hypothetical protein